MKIEITKDEIFLVTGALSLLTKMGDPNSKELLELSNKITKQLLDEMKKEEKKFANEGKGEE